ncbi:MAG: alkaline phosphatase family protein [Proteobacteria bacterium]|nr:alkaline phosphatase family protein [Pseudomonadota bacterium]
MKTLIKRLSVITLWVFLGCAGSAFARQPLLIISIDGLPPRYVDQAEARGLKIPRLRSFLSGGAFAEGVIGVMPTVTFPSHTTLVTGVSPAVHGIVANTPFDPLLGNDDGWYWYAQDVRAPTLWEAASKAGLSTAALNWSVTVGDRNIDTLLPEFWRRSNGEDLKLLRALSRPEGLIASMEKALGPYIDGYTDTVESDRIRTRFAVNVLQEKKPYLMGVHLIALDGTEHREGPDTPAAYATLEALDGMIGELVDAATAARPDTVIAIVSDHGFFATHTVVNLRAWLVNQGLIKTREEAGKTQIVDWDVHAWSGGGSAAIFMKDPLDLKLRQRVRDGLVFAGRRRGQWHCQRVGREPGWWDRRVSWRDIRRGVRTGILFRCRAGGPCFHLPRRAACTAICQHIRTCMRCSMQKARGAGREESGVIDMRQIAPTFAAVLDVASPSAIEPALTLSAQSPGSPGRDLSSARNIARV